MNQFIPIAAFCMNFSGQIFQMSITLVDGNTICVGPLRTHSEVPSRLIPGPDQRLCTKVLEPSVKESFVEVTPLIQIKVSVGI